MEKDDESKEMLNQALSAGDDWLRKQGVITDFSVNTMIAWVYLNFEQVKNVEMDIDKPNQRLYVRLYLNFWTLVLMTLLRRRDVLLDTIFSWLSEYLPYYEISVELRRNRGGKNEKFIVANRGSDGNDADQLFEPEGNIADAIKARNESAANSKNNTEATTEIELRTEPSTSKNDPVGSGD